MALIRYFAVFFVSLLAYGQIATVPAGLRAVPAARVKLPASFSTRQATTGPAQAIVRLSTPPLVTAVGAGAKQNGIKMTAAQQRAYTASIKQQQDAVMAQIAALGGKELARVSLAHNAIAVRIDSSRLTALKQISGVTAVNPVVDHFFVPQAVPDLATTLAYTGGVAVQAAGYTGQGIRIAMLDSGIDYTHFNFGGSGNIADYQTAKLLATSVPPANLFPTAKVIGGYDFTGDVWPNGALAPDPNPIDLNGHGTHTADIAGGRSTDGNHKGAAPDAKLYAVKICSSVSTACSGVATLQGLDFALDPEGTGTLNQSVDVISLSVGAAFGQREEDASEAFSNIVQFGIVSVVSAGNDGDVPYVIAEASTTPEVISVAATTSVIASAIPLVVNSPASIAGQYNNTAVLDFAPVSTAVTANVVYVGQGCPGDTYLNANVSGRVVLVDRGNCAVSLKIDRAASAGAAGVLIGLIAPGDAVNFSNGGGTNFVPSLVITQNTSSLLKTALGAGVVNATLSPANAVPLSGNIASYSSRGPNYSYNMLKPDVSAPGTISAAEPGTGNGETTESGTSFSCPLTAGSAAVLLSKYPQLTPLDIKALLMESSNPVVYNNQASQPGYLAPMSRMGAGELRLNLAAAASTALWDASDPLAVSLSFGTFRLNAPQSLKKKVIIRNYSGTARTYSLSNTYRDAPNTTGAVLSYPASVTVGPNSTASFTLSLTVTPSQLPTWALNGGSLGNSGETLNTVEYAGYLTVASGPETVHIPWHILPHRAAAVVPASTSVALGGQSQTFSLSNVSGAVAGRVESFSLTGTGTQFPASALSAPGSNQPIVNLRATGVRLACLAFASPNVCSSYAVQFAANTFGQRAHPAVPAEFDFRIDINRDGVTDLIVFNEDIGMATSGALSGQNGVFVLDLTNNTARGPYFYTDADLNSANVIMTVPLTALATSTGLHVQINAPFQFSLFAFDNYYTGSLTDAIGSMQYQLDSPRFVTSPTISVPAGSVLNTQIVPASLPTASLQSGLLLMYRDAKGPEADLITVTP